MSLMSLSARIGRKAALTTAALATAAFAVAYSTPAEAATSRFIAEDNSGYCMGYGNPVYLEECSDSAAARVHTVASAYIGGAWYYQYKDDSGECLGVHATSSSSGAALVFGPCSGTNDHSQFWEKINDNGGSWRLKNGHSGLCADVADDLPTLGDLVIQKSCSTAWYWHAAG